MIIKVSLPNELYEGIEVVSQLTGKPLDEIVKQILSEWMETTGSLVIDFVVGTQDGGKPMYAPVLIPNSFASAVV